MNIRQLKNDFYQSLKDSLIDFSKTEHNKDVYALALVYDSSIGMIMPTYNSIARFNDMLVPSILQRRYFKIQNREKSYV